MLLPLRLDEANVHLKDFTLVRKPTRSKNIDYSKPGAYFVTICTHGRKHLLSKIENVSKQCCNEVWHINREAGAASYSPTSAGGFIVNFPELRLTEIGKTVEDKDDYLKIARYIRDNPKTWFYDRYYNK